MITKLKAIYPSLAVVNKQDVPSFHHFDHDDQHEYFLTRDNDIITISKKELSKKEHQLLLTFLRPYDVKLPLMTAVEKRWYDHIHYGEPTLDTSPVRFVYYSIQKQILSSQFFKSALHELYGEEIPILWQTPTEGIIIEKINENVESINYEHIINILMNDLSVKIKFFIGHVYDQQVDLQTYYEDIIQLGNIVFQYSNKMVIQFVESAPYLLLENLQEKETQSFVSSILKHFVEDEEMIHTLRVFFKNDLNVSETAKQLYMHRNSLQYRIDKFKNETGINVQQFTQALTVQLAIMAMGILSVSKDSK